MEQQLSGNTLRKGLQTDLAPEDVGEDVLLDSLNTHVRSRAGDANQLMRQADAGNQWVAGLPLNWHVMGGVTYGPVHYFILAEILNDEATGRGQIGCFPAPEYGRTVPGDNNSPLAATGRLIPQYRALHNFVQAGSTQPGPLIWDNFNFKLKNPVVVRAQPSYDNTINLLITDGLNPARLINTRFRTEDKGYRIVDRIGERDSNLYFAATMAEQSRQFQREPADVRVVLQPLLSGGKVKGGTWQYFFCYVTQDGLETDVVAWSPRIPVFDYTSYSSARGTDNETTRRVTLELSGLDQGYQFLRVYAVRRFGSEGSEGRETLRFTPDLTLARSQVQFSHSGYETVIDSDPTILSLRTGQLESYQTMTESKRHLVIGNIKERQYDVDTVAAFARTLHLKYRYTRMSQPGVENTTLLGSVNAGFQAANQQFAGECWEGGYANPLNCANRLSYGSGEAYAFGVVFTLRDNTLSEVFPVIGLDCVTTGRNIDPDATYDDRGWSNSSSGQNSNGVLRFPVRNAGFNEAKPLLDEAGHLNMLAGTLQFPEIPAAIRAVATGLFIVRGTRQKDRLATGYLLPTVTSVYNESEANRRFDHEDQVFNDIKANGGRIGRNLKCIPAPQGILECAVKKDINGGSNGNKVGAYPSQMFRKRANTMPIINPFRYALYSPDAILEPSLFTSKLHGRAIFATVEAEVWGRKADPYTNNGAESRSWSLFKPTKHVMKTDVFTGGYAGNSYWTLDNEQSVNDGQFGSRETNLRAKMSNSDFYLMHAAYSDYVGIKFGVDANPTGSLVGGNTNTNGTGSGYALHEASALAPLMAEAPKVMALAVSIYPDINSPNLHGPRPLELLRDIYQPETIEYFPVTGKLTWAEIEEQLDDEGRLTFWGGDTYAGLLYRRINRSVETNQAADANYANAEQGQWLGLVAESDGNPVLRAPEKSSRDSELSPRSTGLLLASENNLLTPVRNIKYRLPDSILYNHGYSDTDGNNLFAALAQNVPYREGNWPVRVGVTARHVDGAYQNGYRRMLTNEYTDYDRRLGNIVALASYEDQVLLVQEFGCSYLAISERQSFGDESNPVYIESRSVLPTQAQLCAELGAQHPLAVVETPRGVYGLDINQGRLWRWRGGTQVQVLSELQVEKLLSRYLPKYRNRAAEILKLNVRLSWDATRNDVVIMLSCTTDFSAPVPNPTDPYNN